MTTNQNTASTLIQSGKISLGTDAKRTMGMLSHESTRTMLDLCVTADAARNLNQKGALRLVEACEFAINGNRKSFDKGTAMLVAMIALSQQQTISFDDARFLMGEHVDGAAHVAGVSRARMLRFIGKVGTIGTIRSKLSRTVSVRGFFSIAGITVKGDQHSCTLTDAAKSHPLVLGYAHQLDVMTDGDLALLYIQGHRVTRSSVLVVTD